MDLLKYNEICSKIDRNEKYYITELSVHEDYDKKTEDIVYFTSLKEALSALKQYNEENKYSVHLFEKKLSGFSYMEEIQSLNKLNLIGWCTVQG